MRIETYSVTTRIEVDDLIARAKSDGKSFYEIEQCAARSVPDNDLYAYCIEKAREELLS
ncbi:hypothetical protein D3C81_949790 [compost metagenome]